MTPEHQEKLRLEMEETAVLPPHDPRRREVEAQVVRAGPWAEDEWLEILRQDEQLRLDLRRPQTPNGLVDRLLSIPEEMPRPRRSIARRWYYSAAAAVLLVCAATGWGLRRGGPRGENQLDTVALLAINNHLNEAVLPIESSDGDRLSTELASGVHFSVMMPDLGPEFSLVGGGASILGTHPVAHSRWEADGKRFSLYQFCPKQFSMPPRTFNEIVAPKGPCASGKDCRVLIWSDGECAFALVADHQAPLSKLRNIL